MLTVASFTFNPFQENTYILSNEEKECWIIDPGMYNRDEEYILFDYIEQNGLTPRKIFNTHTHIDHIMGIEAVKNKFNIPLGIHADDQPVLANAKGSAMLFGLPLNATPVADFFINHGDVLHLGKDQLNIRFTPGHSPGSIVFYHAAGNWVIGGDVLFEGSIGRTDLPGGNHNQLLQSIKEQMYCLPDNTIIYPGHGRPTTVGTEKQSNPFVQGGED